MVESIRLAVILLLYQNAPPNFGGANDLGHFAPPNQVSQNAPLSWRGKMTQPQEGHFGKGAK